MVKIEYNKPSKPHLLRDVNETGDMLRTRLAVKHKSIVHAKLDPIISKILHKKPSRKMRGKSTYSIIKSRRTKKGRLEITRYSPEILYGKNPLRLLSRSIKKDKKTTNALNKE